MIFAVVNALTSALFVCVLAALVVWTRPRQPEWVSRDHQRFIASACDAGDVHTRSGRWIRVHGRVIAGGVRIRQSFLSAGMLSGTYRGVQGEQSVDPRFAVFTIGESRRIHLRVRANSPLVPLLESMTPTHGSD